MTIQSSTSLFSAATNYANQLASAVQKADTTGSTGGTNATVATSPAATAATPAAATTSGAHAGHHHHHHGGSSNTAAAGATTASTGTGSASTSPSISVKLPSFASSLLSILGVSSGAQAATDASGVAGQAASTQQSGTGSGTTIYV